MNLIVSDACLGLAESNSEYFPAAKWQRCTDHFYRNVFSSVPKIKVKEVSMMLKAIHASEDLEAAQEKAESVVKKRSKMKLTKAAQKVSDSIHETLAYYSFRSAHWRRIRTNNPLERIMREIRRRTNVVGAFPDGNSALMLVAARLRHIAGTKWGLKRYLNMELLIEMQIEQEIAIAQHKKISNQGHARLQRVVPPALLKNYLMLNLNLKICRKKLYN